MSAIPIVVPKETVSDDTYRVIHCVAADGSRVKAGELIASLETSKSVFDIHSPADGYLFMEHAPGDLVGVGAVLAWIADDATRPPAILPAASGVPPVHPEGSGPRISAAARALMVAHGIEPDVFAHLKNVTREDVVARVRLSGIGTTTQPEWTLSPSPDPAAKVVFIHGGGGHAKMCIDILRAVGGWHIAGILDSRLPPGSKVLEVPVLGPDSEAAFRRMVECDVRHAVCGIGLVERHQERHRLYDRLKEFGFELPNLIHPHASVERSATLGDGNQVMAHAVVGSDAHIGSGCIVNAGSIVSHDCRIGDHVHVAPGAILAGGVRVGARTLIGMGATVYLRVRVGDDVVIVNGADVQTDVESRAIVRR